MSKFQKIFRRTYSCPSDSNEKDEHCYFRRNVLVLVFIFLFIITYLFQVIGLSNLGYEVRRLEEKAGGLETAGNKLGLEVARLQSSSLIKKSSEGLGFVPVDKISYIDNTELTVAVVK